MPYGLTFIPPPRDEEQERPSEANRRPPRWWEGQQQARPASFEPTPAPPPQQDPIAAGLQQALMAGRLGEQYNSRPTDPNEPGQGSSELPARPPEQARRPTSLLEMLTAPGVSPQSWPSMMFGGANTGMGQGWNFMPPGFTPRR